MSDLGLQNIDRGNGSEGSGDSAFEFTGKINDNFNQVKNVLVELQDNRDSDNVASQNLSKAQREFDLLASAGFINEDYNIGNRIAVYDETPYLNANIDNFDVFLPKVKDKASGWLFIKKRARTQGEFPLSFEGTTIGSYRFAIYLPESSDLFVYRIFNGATDNPFSEQYNEDFDIYRCIFISELKEVPEATIYIDKPYYLVSELLQETTRADVTTLQTTKEDKTNKQTDLSSTNPEHYPTVGAVNEGINNAVTTINSSLNTTNNEVQSQGSRITTLEDNQISGFITFQTEADLLAYGSPLTTEAYRVVNDPDPSKNGTYSYDGSVFTLDAFQSANVTTGIVEGDLVNAPSSDGVFKELFNKGIVRASDFEFETTNLFDTTKIIFDSFVAFDGNIYEGSGWAYVILDISRYSDNTDFTIGRFSITTKGYWAFYTNETTGKLTNGGFNPNETVVTNKPVGANFLLVSIKRPNNGPSIYVNGTINTGVELLEPYAPFAKPKILRIQDNEIFGNSPGIGGNSNQNLNTFDDVEFASLTVSGLILDLPTGSGTPPPTVEVGDAWIDTNGGVIKVKLT